VPKRVVGLKSCTGAGSGEPKGHHRPVFIEKFTKGGKSYPEIQASAFPGRLAMPPVASGMYIASPFTAYPAQVHGKLRRTET